VFLSASGVRVLQHRLSEGARLEKERGKEKVALQEALITSEEERLEIAKALIDFQVSHEEQRQFQIPFSIPHRPSKDGPPWTKDDADSSLVILLPL